MEAINRLSPRAKNIKPSATLSLSAKVKALNAAGAGVIGFTAGEPDFDTPQHIKQTAIDALNAGKTKYMPIQGDPSARKAIADKLQRENSISCCSDDIIITSGGKQALYLALQCIVDPNRGDQVLVPTPAWVSYRPMIELAGGEVVELAGSIDNDFKITADQLETAITDRCVGIMLNSPCNPTGTMYSQHEQCDLASVLEKHPKITIISDEIYEKLVFGGIDHFSVGSIDSLAERVITINGLSKAYAMTGWRIGYACAPGNDSQMAKAMARVQGQLNSHMTSFCYDAIAEALNNSAEDVEKMCQAFASRAVLIYDHLCAMDGFICPKPTGAFYVFPDISKHFGRKTSKGKLIDSSMSFAEELLDEAKVAVVPGDDFGECGKNHVRLSFACNEEQINQGCKRIRDWLGALS